MDKLYDLKNEELKKLPNLKVNSTEATFKIYNSNKLLKIYNDPEYSDLEKLEYLIFYYRDKLKTKMPLGPLYIDENFSGAVLYYFKDAYNFTALKNSRNLKLKISRLKMLKNRLIELIKNNLYTTDLHSSNIVLTKERLMVEIIDVDRNGLDIFDNFNSKAYKYVTYEYMKLILEILFEEYNPILSTSIYNTTKILEKYKIDNVYIDCIINQNTNFAFATDFMDYIEKDKKLIK